MPLNQITINFTPCSPLPAEGFRVFYREVGDVSFIEHPDAFTSSPIIFQVEGPTDQPYEGYIISDCGGGLFGPQVPWETVLCPPPEGCCDPVVTDAEAETIIPDGSESGSESVGGGFLRLVFNTNMSGESLGDWNAFFGFTFDNVVYSGSGTIVDLYLSSDLTITGGLFDSNANITGVFDFSPHLVGIEGQAFRLCSALTEVDCPNVTSIGLATFADCPALTDVNLPLITAIPAQGFYNCSALTTLVCPDIITIGNDGFRNSGLATVNFPDCTTITVGGLAAMENLVSLSLPNLTTLGEEGLSFADNLSVINLPSLVSCGIRAMRQNPTLTNITTITLPVCSDLGGTTGDNETFLGITGQNIVLTILTATATDADVAYLQANNSVTLILV